MPQPGKSSFLTFGAGGSKLTIQSARMRSPPLNVLAGLTLVLGICAAHPTKAAGIFTAASIKGSYAYANNTEGVASFGPMSFNGRGGVTLAIKANLPCAKVAPSCKRTIAD